MAGKPERILAVSFSILPFGLEEMSKIASDPRVFFVFPSLSKVFLEGVHLLLPTAGKNLVVVLKGKRGFKAPYSFK